MSYILYCFGFLAEVINNLFLQAIRFPRAGFLGNKTGKTASCQDTCQHFLLRQLH